MSTIIPPAVAAFAAERHLGVLGTTRLDGSPHLVPVGFTLDGSGTLRIITFAPSVKARNAGRPNARASVSWVDGGRWATLEGAATVRADVEGVRAGVEAYATKYRPPKERSDRVVIEIAVDRVMASALLRDV